MSRVAVTYGGLDLAISGELVFVQPGGSIAMCPTL